jgi:hypothetical protein
LGRVGHARAWMMVAGEQVVSGKRWVLRLRAARSAHDDNSFQRLAIN